MPAVDLLLSRINRQLVEVGTNIHRLEQDPTDGALIASISAALGTLSRSINHLEQVLKRETLFKEQHKESLKECEKKFAQHKFQFDSLKSQRLEIERRRRRNELIPEHNRPLLPTAESQYSQEKGFLDKNNNQIDQVIEVGSYALERLRNQGKTMKSAHKKALDAAMSLDIGKTLIRVISRKNKEDKIIFYVGIFVLIFVFYLCWRYFVK